MATDTQVNTPRNGEATAAIPENRRAASRYDPGMRAAVWFNIGAEVGELCTLQDISLSGFGIVCNQEQLALFAACDHPLYCVLLLGVAHFGCMVYPVESVRGQSCHVGCRFDAVSEDDIRLVQGLIARMAAREAEQACDAAQ